MARFIKCVTLIILVGFTAAVLISVPACSKKEEKTAAKAPAKKPAPKPATATTPAPPPEGSAQPATPEAVDKPKKPEKYSYKVIRSDGQPKRSPLAPIQVDPTTPIKMFDVSQLGVNGVIIHGIKKANLLTPTCISTEVRVGDAVGMHDGRIVDISLDGIRVIETYLDATGNIQEYERVINNQPSHCR